MDWLQFREPVSAWSHGLWMLLAIPGTALLAWRSRGERAKQISLVVFGISLILCYAGSLLFHASTDPMQFQILRTLDFIGIYLLIAGSYTPAAVVILRGRLKWGVLAMSWLLAGFGIMLRLISSDLAPLLSTGLYLAMGWGAILFIYELARRIPMGAFRLLMLGGVLYSVGALINLAHWPTFIPGVVGSHEIFHLFVMAGSMAHFWFMLRCVVPYPSPLATVRPVLTPAFLTQPIEDEKYFRSAG